MNQLRLRLNITADHPVVSAHGSITGPTAHLLTKTVVGVLRRYTPKVISIDLSRATAIDFVGYLALRDCKSEATRMGTTILFTPPQEMSRRQLRTRTVPTGTICPTRRQQRPAAPAS